MSKRKLRLEDGARIAIIGGGPAGSFFAHFANRLAKEGGFGVSITIFDGKDFHLLGPPGCNMCAGVISRNLTEILRGEGIVLSRSQIQREIKGYYFQTAVHGFPLTYPSPGDPILTVFRGSGPRFSSPSGPISFDDLLLEHVRRQGTQVVRSAVKKIQLPPDSGPIELTYEDGQGTKTLAADLVVGAFGLNSGMMKAMERLGFGYHPPRTLNTYQMEIPLDPTYITSKFKDTIFVYKMRNLKRVRFAIMIPKLSHVTVSIIGRENARREDCERFFEEPAVIQMFPPGWQLPARGCECRPRLAVNAARRPFTDRLVIIGDASFSRYYKNGIESACTTARLAAESAFRNGIDAESFQNGFLHEAKRLIIRDNLFGRYMLRCFDFISRSDILSRAHLHVAMSARNTPTTVSLREITWNTFTGHLPYKRIIRDFMSPRLQLRLLGASLKVLLHRDRASRTGQNAVTREVRRRKACMRSMGPLRSGQTVAIIGGGPAGVGCAIALRNLARNRGVDLRIVLYEGKASGGLPRYNQCVGVLSPPIEKILSEDLGIPFPSHLVQRVIQGYVLHTDGAEIALHGVEEPSLAVRRINFDNYLLDQARTRGIEVIFSRVTDLEFDPAKVMIYSESNNLRADAVVGAFGLDDGTAGVFERTTHYRQPRYLNSIVTKIHPGMEFMESFGNDIHAFLPSIRKIEFGGVTPKMNHLTINIAGAEVNSDWMDVFLEYPPVKAILPPGVDRRQADLQYFKGKFPISVARGMYGDRYVTIGDAAGLVRPFKGKGINAGFLSGARAAEAMIDVGISKEALDVFPQMNSEITEDLPYGRILRRLVIFGANYGLLDPVIRLAEKDANLQRALFNCVSGHKSFKSIWDETRDWRLLKMAVEFFRTVPQPGENASR
jgi:flavin-dependent dehydrogenase